jgi:hypothetical protein
LYPTRLIILKYRSQLKISNSGKIVTGSLRVIKKPNIKYSLGYLKSSDVFIKKYHIPTNTKVGKMFNMPTLTEIKVLVQYHWSKTENMIIPISLASKNLESV